MLRWRFANPRAAVIRRASSFAQPHEVAISEALRQDSSAQKANNQKDGRASPRTPGVVSKSLAEIARATRSRHLLRAILRECTYLPDSSTRQWTAQHAISRFRTYDFKAWKHRKDEVFADRLINKEKEARRSLAWLRRANEGERDCLLKVMLMAYGRTGKRRHELMQPLLPLKSRDDRTTVMEDVLSAQERGQDSRPGKESRKLDLTPQLRALLKSQIKAAPPALTRRNPRRIDPVIPELNNWLRPMPQKRIKNMKQKQYAHLLDRVQPPLPEDDWIRLHNIVSGKSAVEGPIARRPFPKGGDHSAVDGSALEMVVQYGKVPSKVFEKKDAHTITSRFMRRLYADVFSQCSFMELEEGSTDQWKIIWGSRALAEIKLAS